MRTAAARRGETAATSLRLAAIAAPSKWPLSFVPKASRGPVVDVTTPLTTRAAELARLYAMLGERPETASARTELLLVIKDTVSEFDCVLTREIVALCDRELDQMARGRPEDALSALRGRTQRAFLVFCEQPEFNPEAAKVLIAPINRSQKTFGAMLKTAALPASASNVIKSKMSWQTNGMGEMTLGSR